MEKRWWYVLILLVVFVILVRPLLGLLLVFFLPGFGFVLIFFEKDSVYEKIALSIILSLGLVIINGLVLNAVLGLNFLTVFTSLLLWSGVPLFYYVRNRTDQYDFVLKRPSRKQLMYAALLIFCLFILAAKVYKPHINNPYPIHLDEYSRLLETTHIIGEGNYNNRFNPQFVGHPDAPRRLNPGFQFVLSQFYIVSRVDPVLFFQYLPALFALLTGLVLFSFLSKISNYWVSLLGVLFLSFLKTNDNTLGIGFLVALTMTFPLLYGVFFCLYKAFREKNSMYLLLASLAYFSVLVIHEQTGAAFFPIILLYLLIRGGTFLIRQWDEIVVYWDSLFVFFLSLVIPFFSIYVARSWLWKGSLKRTWEFFLKLIVWEGTSQVRYSYNFVLFYGVVLAILALVGIIFIFKNVEMNVFFIWSLVMAGQVANFYFNQVTYFSYIERIRHHAVLGLVPLSAFGLFMLWKGLFVLLNRYKKRSFVVLSVLLLVLVSVLSLTYADRGDYLPEEKRPKEGRLINPTISEKDYQAILFLKNISEKKVILADPTVSAAIYPISGNYIVASAQNRNDGFGGGRVDEVKRFFSTPVCLEKQRVVYQNNVRYVLSKKPINCPFLEQIYSQYFRYVYEVE